MERIIGRIDETAFWKPTDEHQTLHDYSHALSEAHRQFDHWRSQQPNKRTRLPKELWQLAVALARE